MMKIIPLLLATLTGCASVNVDAIDCAPDGGRSEASSSSSGGVLSCPAAACPTNAQAINCEPSCGPVSPACLGACDGDATPTVLGIGATEFRTSEVKTQDPGCATVCGPHGPMIAWRLKLPSLLPPRCLAVIGPDPLDVGFMGIVDVMAGAPPPSMCTDVHHGGILAATTDGSQWDRYLIVAMSEPNHGVMFTMSISDNCDYLVTVPGCNGTGGAP